MSAPKIANSSLTPWSLFSKDEELCDDLVLAQGRIVNRDGLSSTPSRPTLPGQPNLTISDCHLVDFLKEDLLTHDLDHMAPYLWLVATQSHAHISALHHQMVRGRNVVITENPQLHLVWIDDRVFVKPIPPYLLSHAFWAGCLHGRGVVSSIQPDDSMLLRKASLGYMRTWYYLVRRESDFRIAKEYHLIPEAVSWPRFLQFIHCFARVEDDVVSPRYHFGDLRLSRLNMWAKVFLRRWMFHKVHGQYGAYFAQFYGPVLFIFVLFSTILSAMQVVLATGTRWDPFTRVFTWFSVATLLLVCLVVCGFLLTLLGLLLRETIFALRDKLGLRNQKSLYFP